MANIIIGWGNEIDRTTLSGGWWQSTLPVQKLQTRPLADPARSNGLALSSTRFTATFAGEPPTVECIALVAHNLSATAKWRITAWAGATGRTTGWMEVWPRLNAAEMEWEDGRWWNGVPDAELIANFTPLLIWTGGNRLWPPNQFTSNPSAWVVDIDDTENPAGYVQIGRAFMGRAFKPRFNVNWGLGLGYETATKVEESLLGSEFFDVREPVRVMRFRLDFLNDAEAYGAALLMQRRVGVHGEVVVIPDEDQLEFRMQRNLYGRLRTLSPIENPHYQTHGTAFEVKEIIA